LSTWLLVQILQVAIFFIGVSVGVGVLKLTPRIALIATILILPAPILRVSPGTAGFIYWADLLAAALVLVWFLDRRRKPLTSYLSLSVQRIAAGLLFLFPIISSILALADSETYRNIKYVLLSHARAFGYLIVFLAIAGFIRKVARAENILVLQIGLFSLVAICGLVQYGLGVNLDLWNAVNLSEAGQEIGDFGGGVMGLYRGAVGAWGAGILAVASAILPMKKYGSAFLALVILCCMSIMISVGSRQGVIIGAVVLVYGLLSSLRGLRPRTRAIMILRSLSGLAIVIVLVVAGYWRTDESRFQQYAANRYGPLLTYERLKSELVGRDAEKRSLVLENIAKYPSILLTGVGYGTDVDFSGGRALLYLDSEIFMLVQSNGGLFLLCYIFFLYQLRVRLRKPFRPKESSGASYVFSAVLALYAGILLMWGHFFLMNIGPSQAPVAYWNWALLGGAVGLCTQSSKTMRSLRRSDIASSSSSIRLNG
jgi:hypothetical protein